MRGSPPPALYEATTPGDLAQARALFVEYAQWLDEDLCFQGFAQELDTLPGAYARPRGRLFLAGPRERPLGCIALRPVEVEGAAPGTVGEVKRLYVRPEARGTGLGRRLAQAVVDAAREIGYRRLVLDTLARMTDALALYRRLGFRECPPYYVNPLGDPVYLALELGCPSSPS